MSSPFDPRGMDDRPGCGGEALSTNRYMTALTPREKQILQGVEAGYSNQEIGARLHISPDCVKYHLKCIFVKLGARRRTHAVRLARQFRLLGAHTVDASARLRLVGG